LPGNLNKGNEPGDIMRKKPPSFLNGIKVLARPFSINRYFRDNPSPKLHLGCGDNNVAGWLNADKFSFKADIYLDAKKKFPFKNNLFDLIYSEHMMEHLRITVIAQFLGETFRILKPGAVFRVSVPDLEIFAKKYVENDHEFFKPYLVTYKKFLDTGRKKHKKYWITRTNGSVFVAITNYRVCKHHWMYDFETVRRCAEEVGFSKIIKQKFRESVSADAAKMDQEMRKNDSLYVDLIK
jgi:predicted SAM-dependent methyltransferase